MEQAPSQPKLHLRNFLLYILAIFLVIGVLTFLFFSQSGNLIQPTDNLKQATSSAEIDIEK